MSPNALVCVPCPVQADAARGASQRAPQEHRGQRPHQPVHHGPVAAPSRAPAQRGPEGLRPQVGEPGHCSTHVGLWHCGDEHDA